jgi:hypothetical protein
MGNALQKLTEGININVNVNKDKRNKKGGRAESTINKIGENSDGKGVISDEKPEEPSDR